MRIYLARHGQTKFNSEKRMQGWKNSDLSELGIENARRLGKRLAEIPLDIIYRTPLNRTYETALQVRGDRDIPIVINEHLKEMGFGVWEGETFLSIQEAHPEAFRHFWEEPAAYEPPLGGETFEELFERARSGMEEILRAGHENVLVIAHGVMIKAIYTLYKNRPLTEFWEPPMIQDTSLTILEVKDGQVSFILEADVSHLD